MIETRFQDLGFKSGWKRPSWSSSSCLISPRVVISLHAVHYSGRFLEGFDFSKALKIASAVRYIICFLTSPLEKHTRIRATHSPCLLFEALLTWLMFWIKRHSEAARNNQVEVSWRTSIYMDYTSNLPENVSNWLVPLFLVHLAWSPLCRTTDCMWKYASSRILCQYRVSAPEFAITLQDFTRCSAPPCCPSCIECNRVFGTLPPAGEQFRQGHFTLTRSTLNIYLHYGKKFHVSLNLNLTT